jgi:hypothetical protein
MSAGAGSAGFTLGGRVATLLGNKRELANSTARAQLQKERREGCAREARLPPAKNPSTRCRYFRKPEEAKDCAVRRIPCEKARTHPSLVGHRRGASAPCSRTGEL